MMKKITVTINDYQRLIGLIEFASLKTKMPKGVAEFYEKLTHARMVPQEGIDEKTITMNSKILLREVGSGRETEITLTYPQDAEPRERRVSVFSQIGIALFGCREKDVVSWRVPNGAGLFEILSVTYQPEAAGDFHL
jgi:regulator of nucleoside diphosphate kinase